MSAKIRILYIDDYVLDRELVKDALEKEHGGFEVMEASDKNEFEALLKTREIDVVLSDFNIAGFEGLQVLENTRVYNPKIPVIIVTGTGSEEIAVKAMQQGAADYVIKSPKHIRRLPQTIFAAIEKTRLKEEHEQADLLLEVSEKRLRDLIQLIPAALIVYNAEDGIIESNVEAQRLLGMTADQLKGKKTFESVWSLVHENGSPLPAEDHPINQALSQKSRIMNRIVGFVDPNQDDTMWLMMNAVPEFNDRGNVVKIIVSFFNITERKKAQEALRVSEERLKLAREASNDGLWDWDLKTGNVYFNHRYYTMLGYEPYEMPPSYETWAGLLHPEDRTVVEDAILQDIKVKTSSFEYQFRLREKSGAWRWILGKGQVFERDQDGNALRAIGTHTDIDHLKRVQAKLYESREKYWSILNSVELGIAMISPQMEILETNRKMKDWYPQIQHLDKPKCYQVILDPAKNEACPDCSIIKTFLDGKIHEGIVETRLNDKKIVFRVISSPVRDAKGNVVSAIRMLEDITDKKRLEAQSLQSQKNESLGTLAGGIAHDFNNILSSVIGFTELSLEETKKGSRLNDNLTEVLIAGNRAKELVKRILTFSRKTDQKLKPIRIVPVIQESLKLMKSVLPATIEIHEKLNADPGIVMSDPTQLHQIIVNLCTNAGHAMEEKGGVLDVFLDNVSLDETTRREYPDLKPGDYVRLSVSDTGQGIGPDIVKKIFDPYFTTKEEGKGTGLGLSVVHGLVKMHGGGITVYSEIGKGTSFHVYLPLVQRHPEAPGKKQKASLPSGKERILLIDDEVPILNMQQQNLERLGYAVMAFSSSVDALKKFRSAPDAFDLIITDMTMPGIAGDDLARSLKAIRPGIPIIICTGFSTRITGETASQLPIDGFLMKPIDREKMANTIRNILDAKK